MAEEFVNENIVEETPTQELETNTLNNELTPIDNEGVKPTKKTYKYKDATIDIPTEKAEEFISKYPEAVEMVAFDVDGTTIDIPTDKAYEFTMKYRNAKPINYDLNPKKPQAPQQPIPTFQDNKQTVVPQQPQTEIKEPKIPTKEEIKNRFSLPEDGSLFTKPDSIYENINTTFQTPDGRTINLWDDKYGVSITTPDGITRPFNINADMQSVPDDQKGNLMRFIGIQQNVIKQTNERAKVYYRKLANEGNMTPDEKMQYAKIIGSQYLNNTKGDAYTNLQQSYAELEKSYQYYLERGLKLDWDKPRKKQFIQKIQEEDSMSGREVYPSIFDLTTTYETSKGRIRSSVDEYKKLHENLKVKKAEAENEIKTLKAEQEKWGNMPVETKGRSEKLTEINNKIVQAYNKVESITNTRGSIAKSIMDIENYINKPTEEGASAVWYELKNMDLSNMLLVGFATPLRNMPTLQIAKKKASGVPLSEDEEFALELYKLNEMVKSSIPQTSSGNITSSLLETVPYMLNLALTSGSGTVLKAGVEKYLSKYISSNVLNKAIGTALMATYQGALMGNTYGDAVEATINNPETSVWVNVLKEIPSNAISAWIETGLVPLASNLSKMTTKEIGSFYTQSLRKSVTGKIDDVISNSLGHAGELKILNGLGGEIAEEKADQVKAILMGEDSWTNFFSLRSNLETFAVVALMQGAGKISKKGIQGVDVLNSRKEYLKTMSQLPEQFKGSLITAMNQTTPQAQQEAFSKIPLEQVNNIEDRRKIVDFLNAKASYDFTKGALMGKQQLDVAEGTVQQALGYAQNIENADGNIVLLIDKETGKKYISKAYNKETGMHIAIPYDGSEIVPLSETKVDIAETIPTLEFVQGIVQNKLEEVKLAQQQQEAVQDMEDVQMASDVMQQQGGSYDVGDQVTINGKQATITGSNDGRGNFMVTIETPDGIGESVIANQSMFDSEVNEQPLSETEITAENQTTDNEVQSQEVAPSGDNANVQADIEVKKADIERRRQLTTITPDGNPQGFESEGIWYFEYIAPDGYRSQYNGTDKQKVLDKINAKYDAELQALESTQPQSINIQPTPEIPRLKDGSPDYTQITDPNIYADALTQEFGEEANAVIDELIEEQNGLLEKANASKTVIERRRKVKAITTEISKLNEVKNVLNPQEQVAPQQEIETTQEAEAQPNTSENIQEQPEVQSEVQPEMEVTEKEVTPTNEEVKQAKEQARIEERKQRILSEGTQFDIEERKQRILSEGTQFDKEFGLIPVSEIKTASDIQSNVEKIITTLKENEGNKKFSLFEGFSNQGKNYAKNAGEQVREYFMALDVLPIELQKEFAKNINVSTTQDIVNWGEKKYREVKESVGNADSTQEVSLINPERENDHEALKGWRESVLPDINNNPDIINLNAFVDKVRKLDPKDAMDKYQIDNGFNYEITISYPHSLGEQGIYTEYYYPEYPTVSEIKKDLLEDYPIQIKKLQGKELPYGGYAMFAKNENIVNELKKALEYNNKPTTPPQSISPTPETPTETKQRQKEVVADALGIESQRIKEVETMLNELSDKTKKQAKTTVVRSNADAIVRMKKDKVDTVLIQAFQDVVAKGHKPEAIMTSHGLYIVSSNIKNTQRAVEVWFHEQAGHYGIRLIMPDATQRKAFFTDVYNSVGEANIRKELEEGYDKVTDKAKLGEEYFGRVCEKVARQTSLNELEQGVWENFLNKLREFISNLLPSAKLSQGQIESIAKASIQNIIEVRQKTDIQARQKNADIEVKEVDGKDTLFSIAKQDIATHKAKQFEIINNTNPMLNSYQVGIRSVNDIKTFDEAIQVTLSEGYTLDDLAYPDVSEDMINDALQTGKITVYSSKQIKNGNFVTPSFIQAQEYAGGKGNKVYSQKVNVNDVAWINLDEGQYANTNEESTDILFSIAPESIEDKLSRLTPLQRRQAEQSISGINKQIDENQTAIANLQKEIDKKRKSIDSRISQATQTSMFDEPTKDDYISTIADVFAPDLSEQRRAEVLKPMQKQLQALQTQYNDLVKQRRDKVNQAITQAKAQLEMDFDAMFSIAPKSKNPRSGLTKVKGGWTKAKIIKELKEIKKVNNNYGQFGLLSTIASFKDANDLRNHLFYHGTGGGVSGALYPSITISEREAQQSGGGGYGERYFAVSVSQSKRKASNFSGMSKGVSVYPIILNPQAKVIDRLDLSDSIELEDIIEELWNDGVDAVRLGDWKDDSSEQELAVLNPLAISTWSNADYSSVYQMDINKFAEKTDEELEAIIDKSKQAIIKLNEWRDENKRPLMPDMIEYDFKKDNIETVRETQLKNKEIITQRKKIREEYNRLENAEKRRLTDDIRFSISPTKEYKTIPKPYYDKLLTRLNKAFPNVSISIDTSEMERVLNALEGGNISKMAKPIREDKSGNYIGDGSYHVNFDVDDFDGKYPQVTSSVSKSETTETVYVTYRNSENDKSIKVRFSDHENNAVKFGDQLNGYFASRNEILHKLGLKKAVFIPNKRKSISTRQVAKKDIPNYEQASLTIQEMYNLPIGSDLSEYKGKIAKGSNYLIQGDKLNEYEETGTNWLGQKTRIGKYVYVDLDSDLQFLTTPTGELYGMTHMGKIYLDGNKMNANAPIHEYGHIWADIAKKQYPEVYNHGLELIKGTEYETAVRNSGSYKDLKDEEQILNEALVTAIGDRGEQIVDKAIRNKFVSWLKDLFNNIRMRLGINRVADLSKFDLSKMDLSEFVKRVNLDLLGGVPISYMSSSDIAKRDADKLIIGIKGATRLDEINEATIRVDNLKVAEEMEKADKTPTEIRLATGWERGADNLWRYEVEDGKVNKDLYAKLLERKFDENIKSGLINAVSLKELYESEELYIVYPELENMQVIFYEDEKQTANASYDNAEKTIYLYNPLSLKTINEAESTLTHEIQHAIQGIEGFARGGWVDTGFDNTLFSDIFGSRVSTQKENYERFKREAKLILEEKDKFNKSEEGLVIKKLKDSGNDRDFMVALAERNKNSKNWKVIADAQSLFYKETKMTPEYFVKHYPSYAEFSYEKYRKLAGEVEARNAQTRMNFTPEQRILQTLASTEDISRADQIIIGNSLSDEPMFSIMPETIEVDGVKRPTTNSNGKPIANTEEAIKNFWKWFGDSKVVDKDGKPLVVYHGTSYDGFLEFREGKSGIYFSSLDRASWYVKGNSRPEIFEIVPMFNSWDEIKKYAENKGFYFEKADQQEYENAYIIDGDIVTDFEDATNILQNKISGYGAIYEVYLKIRNAKIIDAKGKNAQQINDSRSNNKQDGVIVKNVYDSTYDEGSQFIDTNYIVFSPTQIKSATSNTGTFDPNNPDIRFSIAPKELQADTKMVTRTRDVVREVMQDRLLSVKMLQDYVVSKGGTLTNATDTKSAVERYSSKVNGRFRIFNMQVLRPLTKFIADIEKRYKLDSYATRDYLLAKASLARHNAGTSALSEDVNDTWNIEAVKKIITDYEIKVDASDIAELWDKTNAVNDFSMKALKDAGILTKEQYDNIKAKWDYYVPLRGWDLPDEINKQIELYTEMDKQGVARSGDTTYSEALKKAKGRKSKAYDPISTMSNIAYSSLITAEKNIAEQSMLNFIRQNKDFIEDVAFVKRTWIVTSEDGKKEEEVIERPDQSLFDAGRVKNKRNKDTREFSKYVTPQSQQAKQIEVYENGIKYVIEFKQSGVAEAIRGTNMFKMPKFWDVVMGKPTRFLSANLTGLNPDFIPVNFIRDFGYAMLTNYVNANSKISNMSIINEMGQASKAIKAFSWTDNFDETNPLHKDFINFINSGGATGYVNMQKLEKVKKQIDRDLKVLAGSESKFEKSTRYAKAPFAQATRAIGFLGDMSELTMRYSVYRAGIKAGLSISESVDMAKNITVNFNRKGRISGVLGSLYAFYNAALQGGNNFVTLAYQNKGRMTKVALSFMAMGALWNVAMTMLMGGNPDDDESYYNVNEFSRYNNLIIPTGGKTYIKIPLPHVFRSFFAMGQIGVEMMTGHKSFTQGLLGSVDAMLDGLSPVNLDLMALEGDYAGSTFIRTLLPTTIQPMFDLGFNRNFFGESITKESFDKSTPSSQLGKTNVSPVLRTMAETFNAWSGGDKFKSGAVDINPSALEYLFESYTGGRGRFYLNLVKIAQRGFDADIVLEAKNIPIANRFVGQNRGADWGGELKEITKTVKNDNDLMRKYYKNMDESEEYKQKYEAIAEKYDNDIVWTRGNSKNPPTPNLQAMKILDKHSEDTKLIYEDINSSKSQVERQRLYDIVKSMSKETVQKLRVYKIKQ